MNEFAVTSRISPIKDVDGLTPHNAGLLSVKKAALVACTPSGVMEMFDYHNINLEGKNIVLINRSNLVGKPLYHLLLEKNATVITCHSRTKDIEKFCQSADIIITAVGDRTKFILTPEMIKEGSIVIDVAISRFEDKLVGDCDYEKIIEKASFVTPVPGGVGPMTVAMLLKNTITATAGAVSDEITIVEVREGTDAITSILTNEAHTLNATSAGVVSDFTNSGTELVAYEGANQMKFKLIIYEK